MSQKTVPLEPIHAATARYEAWLAGFVPIVQADLTLKHSRMAASAFAFMRGTFYRFMQTWERVTPQLRDAPSVLAVGDLHLENFGTWRDAEARLVWGINDFDEAAELPYTLDLLRLATGARLAIAESQLKINPEDACKAVLEGYAAALKMGGSAFVLEAQHGWLRTIAEAALAEPAAYWAKLAALPTASNPVPAATRLLEASLPARASKSRILHRVAGLGSLGRERLVCIADWNGAALAREAKPLAPSAAAWASGVNDDRVRYADILSGAIRAPDPSISSDENWIVRRLAPDSSRIDLSCLHSDIRSEMHEEKLLYAMGWETANLHLGSHNAVNAVGRDLEQRPKGWLRDATRDMAAAVTADWKDWKRG